MVGEGEAIMRALEIIGLLWPDQSEDELGKC